MLTEVVAPTNTLQFIKGLEKMKHGKNKSFPVYDPNADNISKLTSEKDISSLIASLQNLNSINLKIDRMAKDLEVDYGMTEISLKEFNRCNHFKQAENYWQEIINFYIIDKSINGYLYKILINAIKILKSIIINNRSKKIANEFKVLVEAVLDFQLNITKDFMSDTYFTRQCRYEVCVQWLLLFEVMNGLSKSFITRRYDQIDFYYEYMGTSVVNSEIILRDLACLIHSDFDNSKTLGAVLRDIQKLYKSVLV